MKQRKPKLLKEIDEFVLERMDKSNKEAGEISKIEQVKPICKKCSSNLKKVLPEIEMNDLVLYECTGCGDREYI